MGGEHGQELCTERNQQTFSGQAFRGLPRTERPARAARSVRSSYASFCTASRRHGLVGFSVPMSGANPRGGSAFSASVLVDSGACDLGLGSGGALGQAAGTVAALRKFSERMRRAFLR